MLRLGKRNGLISAVRTYAVNVTVNGSGPYATHSSVKGKYGCVLGRETNVLGDLAAIADSLRVNVVLNAVDKSIPLIAAVCLLNEELSTVLRIYVGVDELIAAVLGGVKRIHLLAEGELSKYDLVRNTFLKVGYNGCVVNSEHLKGVRSLLRILLTVRNSRSKSVGEFLRVNIGKINGVVACLSALYDLDLVAVAFPCYREFLAVNNYLLNNVEVCRSSLALVLVDVVKHDRCLSNALFIAAEEARYRVDYFAAGKHAEAKNDNEQK